MENKTENKTELNEQEKQELLEKIVALKQLPGLEINLCGSWVWIGGDTKPNKDALKPLGCWWAAKKQKRRPVRICSLQTFFFYAFFSFISLFLGTL